MSINSVTFFFGGSKMPVLAIRDVFVHYTTAADIVALAAFFGLRILKSKPDSVGDILILIGGVKVKFKGEVILLSKET